MRRRVLLGSAVTAVICALAAPAAQATFPGANGKMVAGDAWCFSADCNSWVENLYSADPDGSAITELTPASVPSTGGVWSPDGSKIAYLGSVAGVPGEDGLAVGPAVGVMSADGSNQTVLPMTAATASAGQTPPSFLPGSGGPINPPPASRVAWVPGGDHIVYSNGLGTVWETDLSGAVQTPVLPGRLAYLASVSPDGKEIAYTTTDGSSIHVADFPLGTSDRVVAALPSGVTTITGPHWSADSSRIVFDELPTGTGNPSIATVRADGGGLQSIGSGWAPTYSPDGQQLAFLSGGPIGFTPPGNPVMVANADGSAAQQTPLRSLGGTLDWQPLPG